MEIGYTRHPDTGVTALEEGLAAIDRTKDIHWLVGKIDSLTEAELMRRFEPWPDLVDSEGVWGSIKIDPYVVMCQLDMPPRHERALGAQPFLKVDRAGTREDILERLRELG
jgi:hypothetical protein